MATAESIPMEVVEYGSAYVADSIYKGDGSAVFKKGDLCRVTTSGQIKRAAVDTDTTGSVHGMVLEDWTTAPTTSQFVKVLMFGSDTVLAAQLYAASGSDAEPQDVAIGTSVTLRDCYTSNSTNAAYLGIWNATVTTTKGNALIVAKPGEGVGEFDPLMAVDVDSGIVHIRFIQSILDGHAA